MLRKTLRHMVQEVDLAYSPHLPSWKYLYSQGTALAEQNSASDNTISLLPPSRMSCPSRSARQKRLC